MLNFLYISWDADVLTVFYAWNKTYLHALVTSYHSIFSSRDIQHDLNSILFISFFLSLCLCAGRSCSWRHYVSGLSATFLWTWYLKNTSREFLQIWCKCPLGREDELIRFWWSTGQKSLYLVRSTRYISGHHSTIHMLITTTFKTRVSWDKTKIWSHFIHKKVECQHHCDVNVLPII